MSLDHRGVEFMAEMLFEGRLADAIAYDHGDRLLRDADRYQLHDFLAFFIGRYEFCGHGFL